MRCSSNPVLQQEAVNPLELTEIVADQSQAFTTGMGGNVQVVDADRQALALQTSADLAIVQGSLGCPVSTT